MNFDPERTARISLPMGIPLLPERSGLRAAVDPKHVHKALRRYLGIENTPGARRFPFNNTEDFAFFG